MTLYMEVWKRRGLKNEEDVHVSSFVTEIDVQGAFYMSLLYF